MPRRTRFSQPYIKYSKCPKACIEVKDKYFEYKNDQWFDNRHIVSTISKEFNVKQKTLRGWIKNWSKDKSWMPFDTQNHGKSHRIFTDLQENSLMDYIDANYISEGNYFSDKEFQTLAFEAFDQIHKDDDEDAEIKQFSCSTHFIQNFKQRHNVSSRLAHFKTRPKNTTKEDLTYQIDSFKATIQSLIEEANAKGEPVVNGDETGFQIFPNCIKTWAYKNSKNIAINVQESTKRRISVMSSITSSNEKLPLFVIAGAKSEDEKDEILGDLYDNNVSTYSTKSYMTTDCFLQYLQFIRNQFNEKTTIHLIIDSYSTHKSFRSILKAKELNINLYFIPSGLTDILQPLDVAIFAPLKSIVNSKISRFLFGNQNKEVGMKQIVTFIQDAYKELSMDNLVNAWEQYY